MTFYFSSPVPRGAQRPFTSKNIWSGIRPVTDPLLPVVFFSAVFADYQHGTGRLHSMECLFYPGFFAVLPVHYRRLSQLSGLVCAGFALPGQFNACFFVFYTRFRGAFQRHTNPGGAD